MSTMRTAVMQRHAWKDRTNDLYETPACATQALIQTGEIGQGKAIWEPFAGRGAIVSQLRAGGLHVIAQDLVAYEGADATIETPIDFLMERKPPLGACVIVTNPPYKMQDQFIRHGLSFSLPVIVLLRLAALEGAGRADLIDKHLRRVWVGIERLPMMHRDGWEGPKNGNSGAPFAWFVFEPGERYGAIKLRRISWRAAA
jgi:hypothetical protein